jgi:hypothetical protein
VGGRIERRPRRLAWIHGEKRQASMTRALCIMSRLFLYACAVWVPGVCVIALYERFTVDPWSFLGEDRGAIFFRWAPHLDYSTTPFGDFVMVLDAARFWLVLLGPVLALGALAMLLRFGRARRNGAWHEKP